MIDLTETTLQKAFPKWKTKEVSQHRIEMIVPNGEADDEVSQVVSFLYGKFPKERWTFQIDQNRFIAKIEKSSKYNRMYTSGCFDIFHYGHLNILVKSKELCNYLIVGVSTDELIEKEKGKRPIIPFEERVKVVQSIGLVDEVIAQTDKNKQRIVDEYRIDAISVGSDWKGKYPKVSCAMEYFDYTKNVSSTILREALKLNQG
ncbi:adenylyltransferase/cytidyltransferase family protein [Aggregatimonas sangjinii]|nr:adenylyltransferase/cytidyltransferase family protein [Aggregatimonas sangjinii]